MDPILSQWLADAGFDPAAVAANPTQLRTLTASWRRETSHAELQTDITAVLDETRRELRAVAGAEVSRLNTIAKAHDEVVAAWALDLKDHREIRARAADLRRQATEENWTAERAELAFLRMGRPQRVVTANYGATEMQPRVLLAAACRSCMMPEAALSRQFDAETLDQASRRYPTIGLKQLLVEAAAARGWSGRWIQNDEDIREVLHYALPPWSPENSRRQLTAEASTFALPGILSSLANKFLYQGFWAVESAWREIAASRPVTDFKPHHSFRFYGDLTYEKVGANGEIKHGSVGELQYVNAAQTYAKMFTTTRQDIRNDDLGALAQLPQAMGMGAAYALNEIFWKLWLSNTQATAAITAGAGGRKAPTVGASTATFWSSGNANYISGAATALGSTALTTAEKTFNEQTKPDGHPLGIPAEILLVPPALKNVADRLFTSDKLYEAVLGLASTAAASKDVVPTDNPHKGLFKVVMSRYLSAAIGYTGSSDTAWWLMAAPAVLPCCEIAFLDGQQTPTVQSSEADFNVLGIQHRGYYDFGCALTECRGSLMSAGA
jgi:phage major head subunit gpT-like protein